MEPLRLIMPSSGKEVRVAPESGRAFALAFSPQGMRFERGGSNLYISGPDGAQITITEYFAHPELAPFHTGDGKLVSGADFLMVMNPDMDLAVSDASAAFRGGRASFFSPPDKTWDEGVFYSLTAGGDIPDYGQHADWTDGTTGPLAPEVGTSVMGNDNVRYWIGRDACQGQAFIQELEGSISVSLITPPGAAVKPFLTYVALNGEDSPLSDYCMLDDSENGNSLFQDGPMGRASTTLHREPVGDTLVLAAESFYSFQAYYGGWLSMVFPSMHVDGIEILMNAPSGQSVVDLQDYFGNAVFSDVPIAWSYDESPKVAGSLAEFADEGFNLVELLDALGPEPGHLPDPHARPAEGTLPPRVENVVLVRADTNDVVKLSEDWTGEGETADISYRTFTLDEQTLLIQGEEPAANDTEK